MSGGLDSQLAVRVLQSAGAEVEAVTFVTPFFDDTNATKAAAALNVNLRRIDFLDDELALLDNPPHGFGGAMNPCIDCHAAMIRRAGDLMRELSFDFVATGEVLGQRPMSQNAQALAIVAKTSGLQGRLVRPLSAKLLAPTIPEEEGKLDREKLLDISGRSRARQIALAEHFGLRDYPSPAGGCKLTEKAFARKLRDLKDHEGFANRALIELLRVGRRFRLPGGSGLILGRDEQENATLTRLNLPGSVCLTPEAGRVGPVGLVPQPRGEEDIALAKAIVHAWCRGTTEADRAAYKQFQII